jgi:transcriptional regulator with XRE-family HTH domain
MQRFGSKLQTLRTQHQLTLTQLAQALGYSAHGYISEIESGKKKPTAEFILSVARLFDVAVDTLLKDELELSRPALISLREQYMSLPFVARPPSDMEVERLRLILSTYQDGTGQERGGTLPGWRDFERSVALAFGGQAQENKAIFDVLLRQAEENVFVGISCKMRGTLRETERSGRVTIEVSNSARLFWNELGKHGLNQQNYKESPTTVGEILLQTVESWHNAVDLSRGGRIDVSRSLYLALSWSANGLYQLFHFSLRLPSPQSLQWGFPMNKHGTGYSARLVGLDDSGTLFEWYGDSGGQLKYYPRVSSAIWSSKRFQLEPLPEGGEQYGVLAKAQVYFPDLWKAATGQ